MIISFIKENGFQYTAGYETKGNILADNFNLPNLEFGYYCKNNKIGNVSGEIANGILNSTFDLNGNKYQIKYDKYQDLNVETNAAAYGAVLSMNVDKQMEIQNNLYDVTINDISGNRVGSLKYHISEEHGTHRYYYFTLDIDGLTFTLYFNRKTVMKLKSSFYSIYLDNKLIAMSDNPSVGETELTGGPLNGVDLKKSIYSIYLDDEQYAKYVCLFIYILHLLDHEYDFKINENKFYSKELDEKFDYSFIDKIRAAEDPQYLPENMTSVKEQVTQVKKSHSLTVFKYVLAALIIIIIMFLITRFFH